MTKSNNRISIKLFFIYWNVKVFIFKSFENNFNLIY